MQNELEDKDEEYSSILHEEWCDLLSTIEFKDNSKRSASHIKRFATSKALSVDYYSGISIRVPRKNKESNGVLPDNKHHGENIPKHHGAKIS